MRPVKKRIAWIDLLETIAIFAVVLCHCTAHIANSAFQGTSASFQLHYFFHSILAICVPLFFFVNGYLLFRKDFDLKKHLSKTLKFILIALFWYALTLAFLVFLNRGQLATMSLLDLLSSLKPNINHLWYIGALVCLYVFFPLLKLTYDHHRKAFVAFVLICAFFTFGNSLINEGLTFTSHVILHCEVVYQDINFFNIFNPFRGIYGYTFVYFCLGGIVNYYFDKITQLPRRMRNLLALIGLALGWFGSYGVSLLYSLATNRVWDHVWFGYDTIFTLLCVVSIFLLCLNWQKPSKILATISRNTLGIYLIHMLVIFTSMSISYDFIMQYISPLADVPFIISFIGSLGYATLVLLISLGLSLLLRRIPLVKQLVS